MTTAIDETLSKFIEKLQHEKVDGLATGSGHVHKDAAVQEPPAVEESPASSRRSGQQRVTLYSRVATALIVLLLAATGASYFLYRAEREAITSRIDAIVRTPLGIPLEQRLLELEKSFVDTSGANEMRLQAIEHRLAADHQAYEQQLQDMGQRLMQVHEPQEHRLQRVEQRLANLQQPDGKRLQAIESRLVQITARMDDWAAVVADLSNDDQSVAVMPAATVAEPPAVRPIEPVIVARNNVVLRQPQSLPEVSQDKPPSLPEVSQDKPQSLPEVSQDKPQRVAGTAAVQGKWVINIGSYNREKTAAKKLGEFQKQGVTAELVTATVRGKTIYRIQVPGFDSMAEARGNASQVREALGLKETWIRRR